MDFKFDHLVHFVEEPYEVIPILKERGIHAVEGGQHENRPTYNVLSYFDLSYIEFIGTSNREELEAMTHPKYSNIESIIHNHYQEGFVRFVIRTENIDKAADHFKKKGLEVVGPKPLSRRRPDGTLLEWKLLYVGKEDEALQLPYIIEWGENDETRKKELMDQHIIAEHLSGASFSHVTFAVNHLDATIQKWSDWLELEEIGHDYIDKKLNAVCRTLKLPGGNLVFASPLGEGLVKDVLDQRGEKPFLVQLMGHEEQAFELFGGHFTISCRE